MLESPIGDNWSRALAAAGKSFGYMHDKAPGDSEGLMISVIDIGLKLDAALATLSAPPLAPLAKPDSDWWRRLKTELDELVGSLEQFDAMAGESLTFLDEAELARFVGAEGLTIAQG